MTMILEGEHVKLPLRVKEARLLIGKKVKYLCNGDIDKSGRGYFYPRNGTICDVVGKGSKNLELENQNYIFIPHLVEMVILGEVPEIREEWIKREKAKKAAKK